MTPGDRMSAHDVLLEKLDSLKEDTTEIRAQVVATNGRLREAEKSIATHWTLWKILGAVLLALIPVLAYAYAR